MGIIEPDEPPLAPTALADALFTPVQQRVLGFLFGEPERRFQSAVLIRLTGSGTGATHRVLKRLADSGLVRTSVDGRQKYYQANPDSPVFQEMVGLVRKTSGLVTPLRKALAPFADSIRAAFVYGSIASGEDRADSDIDLMVIAEGLSYPTIFEALQSAEAQLDRTINPNLLTPDEWRLKKAQSGSFAAAVQNRPRLFVVGSDSELG
jgi:predicted nucleotidyltransferase